MFVCVLFFAQYSFYHIIMHGMFKFLLFILSGSLIYVQMNFQLLVRMKVNSMMVKVGFISGLLMLVLGVSKEGIVSLVYVVFGVS